MSRSLHHLMLRQWVHLRVPPGGPLPASMQKPVEALELMDLMREALDRDDERDHSSGVMFLRSEAACGLPAQAQAKIHSELLPAMDHYRWPLDRIARLIARAVRKLAAPFAKRQEQFNLDVLEAMKRLEARLDAQQRLCRQLQRRLGELENGWRRIADA